MQFIINNATILGFSQRGTFFEGDFRFGNKRIINLECLSTDISNESDVSSHAVRDLIYLSKTDDYQRVHINGISFDTVKFTSFDIDGDEWVRGATCSISLEAYEEGTIESNLGGTYYEGLDFQGLAHFLDDFSEDFSFSRAENSVTYTHSVTLKFSDSAEIKGNPRLSGPVALAKEFAGKLFQTKNANRPDFAFSDTQLQSIYKTFDDDYSRTISEEYDNINNTCTFTENFEAFDKRGPDNSYSTKSTQTFEFDQNGIITVSEQGEILGLSKADYEAADAALNTTISVAKARINVLFERYKDVIKTNTTCEIPNLVLDESGTAVRAITSGKTINIYEGIISYSVTATNDPSKGSTANHNYTTQVQLDGDYFTSTENGTIEGIAEPLGPVIVKKPLNYQKYDQARTKFVSIDTAIDTRVKGLISNPSPQYITNTETVSEYKGRIAYTRSFSNAPRYKDNDGIAKQITVDVQNSKPIIRHSVESIINSPLPEDEELAAQEKLRGSQILQIPGGRQTPVGYSLAQKSNSIQIVGKRDSELTDLLDLAKNNMEPGENYLKSCTYSFNDENSMKLNMNASWE